MAGSRKLQQRQALGKDLPISSEEFENACLLADVIEATPQGQRTARMQAHLDRVRAVVAAET